MHGSQTCTEYSTSWTFSALRYMGWRSGVAVGGMEMALTQGAAFTIAFLSVGAVSRISNILNSKKIFLV